MVLFPGCRWQSIGCRHVTMQSEVVGEKGHQRQYSSSGNVVGWIANLFLFDFFKIFIEFNFQKCFFFITGNRNVCRTLRTAARRVTNNYSWQLGTMISLTSQNCDWTEQNYLHLFNSSFLSNHVQKQASTIVKSRII
jgi:hypothetical protein